MAMPKPPASAIGLDVGRYALKSVLLQRRGSRFAVTHFASQPLSAPVENAEHLGRELKTLFRTMGGGAKVCAVGISSPDALIRIIEQPETPTELLRDALRLNGMALLNQDCRGFVLDCDRIPDSHAPAAAEGGAPAQHRYLVGGLPREQVNRVAEALDKNSTGVGSLQLAPICAFNAFEFAQPEIFNEHAFFLVDIGHSASTMMLGAKRELVLVRTIDFGGRVLVETLMALSGESREGVLAALEDEDEVMVENARMALMLLTREIGSSIGFFEGRREETISRIFVSGGPAKSRTLLKVMSEELHMPCEPWNAFENCETAVAPAQRDAFAAAAVDFNVACGAAAELLTAQ
jgi:Tfp pilus assembly PilM family ATPase